MKKRCVVIVLALLIVSVGFCMYELGYYKGVASFDHILEYNQQLLEERAEYFGANKLLEEQLEKADHSIWHLQQKQDEFHKQWQDCLQELIDARVYELEFDVSDDFGSLRSYKKTE